MWEAATICPAPCKLTVDLLTLKVVSESRVTWSTSVPVLVFLGLSILKIAVKMKRKRGYALRLWMRNDSGSTIAYYCERGSLVEIQGLARIQNFGIHPESIYLCFPGQRR